MARGATTVRKPLGIKQSYRLGVLYMLVGMCLLSTMDAVGKWLIDNGMHSVQILALRSLIIVPILLLVYASSGQLKQLKPARPIAQALRGLSGFLAPLCYFLGISQLPLTAAVVVFFSSIFMTTLLSVFFLGERVGRHRWIAVGIGYCGVVIAIEPTSGGNLIGYLLVLFSSLMYSMLFISGRRLSATDTVASLVMSYNFYVGVAAAVLLPWFWQAMSATDWFWVVVLSLVAVTGHFSLTHAFSAAQASQIAPFEYTAIIWTLLFDTLIWNELPGAHSWVGAVIIIGSGLYVFHREQINTRRATQNADSISRQPK